MAARKDGRPKGWNPTPSQIRRVAARIRASWDARTEYERRVMKNPRWTVPYVTAPEGFSLTDSKCGKKKKARDVVTGASA